MQVFAKFTNFLHFFAGLPVKKGSLRDPPFLVGIIQKLHVVDPSRMGGVRLGPHARRPRGLLAGPRAPKGRPWTRPKAALRVVFGSDLIRAGSKSDLVRFPKVRF